MPETKPKSHPVVQPQAKAKSPQPVANVDPFVLQKWKRVFAMFFDCNKSKDVDWNDFYMVMRRARNIYGAESAQVQYAKKSLESLWEGLKQLADVNKDSLITPDEWIALLRKSNCEHPPKWLDDYANYMFKLFDVSADDVMDLAEYTDGMDAYGYESSLCHESFKIFAVDKKGAPKKALTPAEWRERFHEYFFSKDKKALGNHLFGKMDL